MANSNSRSVPALRVHQWLPGWEKIIFDAKAHSSKPPPHFYLFSLPARELRSLSGIVRRSATDGQRRTDDLGIQRQHDPDRSDEIKRFVEFGYPWSTLSKSKRASTEFNDLRKPGWLPTAIVLNVLTKGSERSGSKIDNSDVVTVLSNETGYALCLPYEKWSKDWHPQKLPPFEVIDGQHRLWAFDEENQFANYELPVVAFVGLDISWQAYLFWTINIKPKRINPSLAFDLYPLLRGEEWLDRAEGHAVYRETRAQELTEILWSHPASVWYDKINMLGERQIPWVTQSAWIKSLLATLVRPWDGKKGTAGGLFGGRSKKPDEVLGWNRAQQAAFLISSWQTLQAAILKNNSEWARLLRKQEKANSPLDDPAFFGPHTLITTDQGVRGYLQVVNDIFYTRASKFSLNKWTTDPKSSEGNLASVDDALSSLHKQDFYSHLEVLGKSLASFDWRTSSAPGLSEPERRAKLVFRGSSGYKELRQQLLEHMSNGNDGLASAAKTLV